MAEARDTGELRALLAGVVDARAGIVTRLIVRPSPSAVEPELPIGALAILARGVEGACARHGVEMGSGKGTSNVGALVSAVGEAVERYSAARVHRPSLVRAAVAELREDFLAPADLCPYADAQYTEPGFPCVRLSPLQPIDWARGTWLDSGAPVLVPALPT